MRLLLVRHGESEGNASGVFQGRLEYGLTPSGEEQARLTAERLAADTGITRILSSPLGRALRTAEVIAARCGMAFEVDEDLAEYHIGEISGLTGAQIRERFPHVRDAYARGEFPAYPGEEGREVFHARVGRFLEGVSAREGDTLAVAHGGVVAAACYAVLGLDARRRGLFSVSNCSLTDIRKDGAGRWVIARHNDTCHLDPTP